MPKSACLIYGPDFHYLDHLAPLASNLKIPVVTEDERIEEQVQKYYPETEVKYFGTTEIHQRLVKDFDSIIYSFTKKHFDAYFSFAQDQSSKYLRTIWCPHGHSDKDNLQALEDESVLLLYGDYMKNRLNMNISHYFLGNYRYQYFLKHKNFYKAFDLPKGNLNYLYAPTWNDYEDSTSLKTVISFLLDLLPDHINLIIKLHPNTWLKDELKWECFFAKYTSKKNLFILKDFPPIYPLLQQMDVYIGDMSSIGYDFLIFQKPMFFLINNQKNLHNCGFILKDYTDIYKTIEKLIPEDHKFYEKRQKLYQNVFSEPNYENCCHI